MSSLWDPRTEKRNQAAQRESAWARKPVTQALYHLFLLYQKRLLNKAISEFTRSFGVLWFPEENTDDPRSSVDLGFLYFRMVWKGHAFSRNHTSKSELGSFSWHDLLSDSLPMVGSGHEPQLQVGHIITRQNNPPCAAHRIAELGNSVGWGIKCISDSIDLHFFHVFIRMQSHHKSRRTCIPSLVSDTWLV